MEESNGNAVLYKKHGEPLFRRVLLVIFVGVCFWAGISWFFGILVSAGGHRNAAGGVFLSWGIAFIIVMAVLLNSDK